MGSEGATTITRAHNQPAEHSGSRTHEEKKKKKKNAQYLGGEGDVA